MVTIYDPHGEPIERLPLDAKECIDSGYYTAKPPEPVVIPEVTEPVVIPEAVAVPVKKTRRKSKTVVIPEVTEPVVIPEPAKLEQ